MKIKNLIVIVMALWLAGAIHPAKAQTTNSTQQLLQMRTFREGLVWTGKNPPGEAESAELLEIARHLQEPGWTARVEKFLSDHPDSPWAASLHHDYASFCRRTGRITEALENWQAAWTLAQHDPSAQGVRLGGAILANWMDLLSSFGRLAELKELIAAGDRWDFVNHQDFDKYQGAKNSYYLMLAHPGIAYRCGTFALKAVGSVLQPGNRNLESLAEIPSPAGGFSVTELMALAKQYGLDLVAVRRTQGQELVVPSVVHWRQNHYAAIIAHGNGLYLVSDPTFGREKWMSAEAINEEASGEFLIPSQSPPTGWTQLAQEEMAKIHGMGLKNNMPDPKDCGCPPSPPPPPHKPPAKKCPSCIPPGMPVWWVTEPYINLWLSDVPITYLTSRGEPFPFRITFKQRDSRPVVPEPYFQNTGWNQSWLSSIHLTATNTCVNLNLNVNCMPPLSVSEAALYLADGGEVDFAQGQSYDQETRLSLLSQFKIPSGSGAPPSDTGLRLVHSDGSQDIYGLGMPNFVLGGENAEGDWLMTQHIDQNGNSTWFNYTNNGIAEVLTSVIDPDGRTNTLSYVTGNSNLLVLAEVDGPYGLRARFKYDARNNLTNIVDAAGMSSSITYNSSNNPTALITPYGTNTFSLADNGLVYGGGAYGNAGGDDNGLIDRSALIVDPTGATNLYMYRYDSEYASNFPSVFGNVPSGTPLGTLDSGASNSYASVYFRNSYHWGPRQYGYLSTQNMSNFVGGDYLLAETEHWLEDTDYLNLSDLISVERDPSPDGGNTEGLKTFYDYQGKTVNYVAGTNALPAVIAWQLPNGQTYYEYRLYDYFGNITSDITTYTTSSGSVGTRTNQFVFANNTYANITTGGFYGDAIYPPETNTYTVPDLLTKVIGADGNPIWTYGGFDPVIWTNFTYYQNGQTNLTTQSSLRVIADYATNGVGQTATTTFTAPRPINQYDPYAGGLIGSTFNDYNKVASSTSVAGLTTTNIYNSSGFLAQTIDLQINRTNSYSYGNNGLINSYTDALGLSVTPTWDNLLRLTSVQYPDGTYVSNLYDRLDVGGTRDRLGNWTTYAHDGARHLTGITNANNAVTTFSWCGCGSLTEILDPLENPYFFNYDTQGSLTNISFPDGSALNYQFDAAERQIRVADGAGRAWQLGYNNQGLVTTVSNAYGLAEGVIYDIRDRRASVTDANNVTVANTFDPLDRVLTRMWPDGIGEGFGYSAQGLAFYTNRDQQPTLYGHDAAGRIVAMTNANQEVNQYVYDPANDITVLLDGLNHTNSWQYNQYGWLTNKVDGLGRNAFQYAYNADGWITNRWTPAKGNTGYGYDNVGNLTSIAYPSFSISYGYNPLNQLSSMVDAVGTNFFTFSPVGQLSSETGPWANDMVTNTYVQRLRTALSLSQPSGSWSESYNYDSAWRMTNVVSPAGAFGYSYNFQPASALVSSIGFPNGAGITNGYDSLARLTQTALYNHWGHALDGDTYTPDPLGLRTNIVRNLGLTSSDVAIGYDKIGQLTSWLARETNGTARLNEQLGFGFDAADNLHSRTNGLLAQTFSVDSANELTNVGRSGTFTLSGATPAPATNITVNGQAAQTYGDFTFAGTNNSLANGMNTFAVVAQNVYGLTVTNNLSLNLPANVSLGFDINGNLTNDGARVFAYDSENQLTNVMVAGQWQSSFVYDGLNRRRIARDYGWSGSAWALTNEVHYVYDGYLLVQERDTNSNPLVTYTRGLDLGGSLQGVGLPAIAPGATARGIGGLLARTDANGSTFYHADGNGNITALMDSSENIVARYLYNPFGRLLGQWGSMAVVNEMQFSSMPQHDGLMFYPFRVYEPNFQRWLNRDPIGEDGGVNLYRFVENNPLNWIDTDGRGPVPNFGPRGNVALGNALGNAANNVANAVQALNDQSQANEQQMAQDLANAIGQPDQAQNIADALNDALSVGLPEVPEAGLGQAAEDAAGAGKAAKAAESPKPCPKTTPSAKPQPKPPGWKPDWEKGISSRSNTGKAGGESWWDPNGGEWNYHNTDPWHPDPHWNYNPWDQWNSPWQNIDQQGNAIPKNK